MIHRQEAVELSETLVDTTRLSERGQVVIPKEVRDRLGLRQGSRLLVIAFEDAIVLQKVEVAGDRSRARGLVSKARSILQRLGFKA